MDGNARPLRHTHDRVRLLAFVVPDSVRDALAAYLATPRRRSRTGECIWRRSDDSDAAFALNCSPMRPTTLTGDAAEQAALALETWTAIPTTS